MLLLNEVSIFFCRAHAGQCDGENPPAPPLHRSVLLSIVLGSRLLRQRKSKGVKIASHLGYLIAVNHPLSLLRLEEKHLGPRLERLQHSDFVRVPSWSPCFMPNYSTPIKKKRLSPTPQYKLSPHSVEQTAQSNSEAPAVSQLTSTRDETLSYLICHRCHLVVLFYRLRFRQILCKLWPSTATCPEFLVRLHGKANKNIENQETNGKDPK